MDASPSCPRCLIPLVKGAVDIDPPPLVCSRGHGLLYGLESFRSRFNARLTGFFWRLSARASLSGTIVCPGCGINMYRTHHIGDSAIELDCCPQCFSVWFDAGEDVELGKIFLKIAQARDAETAATFERLGRVLLERDRIIQRYKTMQLIGRFLNHRVYGRARFKDWMNFLWKDDDEN